MRKAFTLIELMVVIMILVILIGLVTYGLSRIAGNQREKSTRTMLANLDSMLQELKITNQLKSLPEGAVDAPFGTSSNHGLMSDDAASPSHDIRFKSQAVVNTQKAMIRLMSVPANKSLLAKLPADSWLSQPNPQVSLGGNALRVVNGKIDPPIPLDGWGNPIIYVGAPDDAPSTNWNDRYGLRRVVLKVDADAGNTDPLPITNPRQEYPDQSAPNAIQVLRTFRPFWASAGQDGTFSFSKDQQTGRIIPGGDDNVYSFEN